MCKDANVQVIVDEMNRRLKQLNLPGVRGNVVVTIRKNCKRSVYRLAEEDSFILNSNNLKYLNDTFCYFQRRGGRQPYYMKVEYNDFNTACCAVIINKLGMVFRYIPNYTRK